MYHCFVEAAAVSLNDSTYLDLYKPQGTSAPVSTVPNNNNDNNVVYINDNFCIYTIALRKYSRFRCTAYRQTMFISVLLRFMGRCNCSKIAVHVENNMYTLHTVPQ